MTLDIFSERGAARRERVSARCTKRVQSTRFAVRERAVLAHAQRQVRYRAHERGRLRTASYLPCSSDNSPTSSDNLDQAVGSMNPHLPGAQDKISRPSQVVRDRRHEITFSVFGLTIVSARTRRKSRRDTLTHAQKKKKKEVGEFCSVLSSLTSVRRRTSAPTLVMMRSPPPGRAPGCQTLSRSLRAEGRRLAETHVLAKTIPLFQNKIRAKPPT